MLQFKHGGHWLLCGTRKILRWVGSKSLELLCIKLWCPL